MSYNRMLLQYRADFPSDQMKFLMNKAVEIYNKIPYEHDKSDLD